MIKNLRHRIVSKVQDFCEINNLNYKEVWLSLFEHYEKTYFIPVLILYRMGSTTMSKLDFLENYEEMASTLTKFKKLIDISLKT